MPQTADVIDVEDALAEELGADLAALASSLPSRLVSALEVTELRSPTRKQRAFRLDFEDGSRLKGRRLQSAERARRAHLLRPALGSGYPELLAVRGDSLLLEWIDGEPLPRAADPDPRLLRRCGEMLGRLHATSAPAAYDAPALDPQRLLRRLEQRAAHLVEGGLLEADRARDAVASARAQMPGDPVRGLIHKDFCGENLLVGADGEPVCIDNVSLNVGPLDFDLARTWYRWPLSDAAWSVFEAAYCEHRDTGSFRAHFAFWAIVVLVDSAALRARNHLGRIEEPLGRLVPVLRRERAVLPPAPASRVAERPGETLHLAYEDFGLRVRAPEADDLRWLSGFLASGFEAVAPRECDAEVALVIDAEEFGRIERTGRAVEGLRAESFAKDTTPDFLDRWLDPEGSRTFRDPRHEIFYRIRKDGSQVTLLARERTRVSRVNLMRTVRELAMERVVATGGLLLHASAVEVGGRIVAFSGPKRSGKTTMMLSCLLGADARYTANDRAVVRLADGAATLRGLPTLVSIRSDTLDFFPTARARLDRVRSTPPPEGFSRSLTPPELLDVVGRTAITPYGRLGALVFPHVGAEGEPLELRRLGVDEARVSLRGGLFRAGFDSALGEAFAARPRRRGPEDPTVAWLSAHLPCYRLRIAAGAPPDAETCRGLLAELSKEPGSDAR